MRYAQMVPGSYVVRTRELSWAKVLSGNICYVEAVAPAGLRIKLTEDCVPKGGAFEVGVEADDGNWYDVSELVMEANSCICPSSDRYQFTSAVAANYRNFVGLQKLQPLAREEAIGSICILGDQNNGNVVFAKTGLYVVDIDNNGYAIVYTGFCDHMPVGETRKLQLKILRVNGTMRNFYPADVIVSTCCKAYEEDLVRAVAYCEHIKEDTMAASTDSAGYSRGFTPGVSELNLGVTV